MLIGKGNEGLHDHVAKHQVLFELVALQCPGNSDALCPQPFVKGRGLLLVKRRLRALAVHYCNSFDKETKLRILPEENLTRLEEAALPQFEIHETLLEITDNCILQSEGIFVQGRRTKQRSPKMLVENFIEERIVQC
mmetsp:Transcript_10250/g.22151  ORF Transcript_10250/g.22151 Transcript_10250/m.22151 type:complete len:137 (+) Transcript_10250:978-1388(+)